MRIFLSIFAAIVFTALGVILIALRDAFVGINFLMVLAGLGCFFVAYLAVLFYPWQKPGLRKLSRVLKWVTLIMLTLLLLSFVIVQSLIWSTARQARDDAPQGQVLLVLGAGLNGETPSSPLLVRLQSALAYLEANPQSVAILSGGQGPGEDIPEALAMQRWLTAYGIDPARLYLEDQSTNTAENFAFSMRYLKELETTQVIVVTNEFHLYRAGLIAKHYGLETELIGSQLLKQQNLIPLANYLREYFAVCKEIIRINLLPNSLPAAAD